ncbi:MAG: CYTH domain-containing protein [Bacteroidaceae bacterium]|nr:CYTH domain-containing protein [Bacteroidaceae bacterium]
MENNSQSDSGVTTDSLPHREGRGGSHSGSHSGSLEIERKFLVKDDSYKSLSYNCTHIEQGYFATEPGKTVRVRIRDEKAYLTIKGPAKDNGLSRYEFETEISLDDAHELMKLCMPGRVNKNRYLVKNGKHVVEVDEFFEENEGLVIAEIELNSEDEAYEKPDFLGDEVTGDSRYYNKFLTKHPYKTWKAAEGQ